MLICILTKNVITSCSVTMMLFLHLEVKPLMTLTTVLYLSCALISGHLAMMLMELTRSEERFSRNAETDLVCRLLLEKKKNKRDQADVEESQDDGDIDQNVPRHDLRQPCDPFAPLSQEMP